MTPDREVKIKLLQELITSGQDLADSFVIGEPPSLPHAYLKSMAYKTMNLLSSIYTLISAGQISDSQILARVLVEAKINLAYLLLLYRQEGDQAFVRIIDAIVLHKNKAILSIDWGQDYQTLFTDWDEILSTIKDHYPGEEFRKIKKFGMFGCGIESRARATNNTEWYDQAFRLFSKNVHCLDMHEILAELDGEDEYLNVREEAVLTAVTKSAASIFLSCSELQSLLSKKGLPQT